MSEAFTNKLLAMADESSQGAVTLFTFPPGLPLSIPVTGTMTWHLWIVNSFNQAIQNVSIKLPPKLNPPNSTITFSNPQVATDPIPAGGFSFASVDVTTDNTATTTYAVTFEVDFEFVTPSPGTSVATFIVVS